MSRNQLYQLYWFLLFLTRNMPRKWLTTPRSVVVTCTRFTKQPERAPVVVWAPCFQGKVVWGRVTWSQTRAVYRCRTTSATPQRKPREPSTETDRPTNASALCGDHTSVYWQSAFIETVREFTKMFKISTLVNLVN